MPFNLFAEPLNKKGQILGCTACPLNNIPGVNKVKGLVRIKGRRAMLWGDYPRSKDNLRKTEFNGTTGDLLWEALETVGLSRANFDIQNVLRCQPLDQSGEEHEPGKRELQCCSVYNDEAVSLNKFKAKVHLILGDIAGQQLLGTSFKKDKPVFWHEPWDAYVVLAQHPNVVLRKGGKKAGWEYFTWLGRFKAVKAVLDHPGRFGFLKAQNYKAVKTEAEFDVMERLIRAEPRRVSFDIEDAVIDGKRVVLVAGFGIGHYTDPKDLSTWKGQSWSVVLAHPESGYTSKHLKVMTERVKTLVEDVAIRKTLQNGSYDATSCREALGATLRGYDYDTRYGTYLRYSFLRSFSLENLTYLFYPEFADYKDVVAPWYDTGKYSETPLDLIVLRNCGDCDITQRLEQRIAPQIREPLVKVYIHAGKVLDIMTRERGPVLDWENLNKAVAIVPKMIDKLERMLKRIAEDPEFDIQKPEDVAALIYDKLELPIDPETGRSTNKLVLEKLLAETSDQTLDLIMKTRTLKKIKSTYLDGYAKSAKLHDGELRTIWHLTGAATGRLRSGKGDDSDAQGIINFQNLHGNPLLQNLLVFDPQWRRLMTEQL